uniref:Protein LATERAL ROOT PRIMORDIUM 1-like n=1 Tax=Nelumbo nucifera TaxID=4432 RepID=A0A822ZLX1_NELNU|nr:TPA_asm: hypothetical protein HUJ06_000978 [Nelumbo nucifera]
MGMVGLRDVLVVAPASSFHHNQQHEPILSDHHHQINNSNAATALGVGVGVGVIPLLTAAPCLAPANVGIDDGDNMNNRNRGCGINLWQNQQPHHGNYLKKPMLIDHNNSENLLNSSNSGGCGAAGSGGLGGTTTTSTATTCQDCGNQAKKDCSHRRCRTCCKSRGFDCSTHVKSTWVPAARRRERQLSATAAAAAAGSSVSTSAVKKPRLISSQTTTASHTSTSNTTPPRSFDTSSSQDASFRETLPGQIRAPAVFKCVRVTAVEDGEDEYAYQAIVKIGGHVFKGFLYDQGVDGRDGFPNISELHLGGGRNGNSSSPNMLDPSDVYAASGGGLLGGTAYGNPIN